MLAYVFWHRPRAGAEGYEAALVAYHQALAEEAIEGFHESTSHAVEDLPWLGPGPAFEDWYLLEAAWALDTLGTAAHSGRLEAPHGRIAELTGRMAAGLYRLEAGEADPRPFATWLSQPAAGYHGQSSLWRRQLVLGPTPEFCLLSDEPPGLEGATPLSRRRVA